jgi:aspartate-semialdehyde dehydrogenase
MKLELVAVVGGESLLGREVRELAEKYIPGARMKLIGADEEEGGMVLSVQGGEAVVITRLDEDTLKDAQVVVLAGTPKASRKTFDLVSKWDHRTAIVDATHTLEDNAHARLRAPMAEPDGLAAVEDAIHVVAHPAAIALVIFFRRLHAAHPVRRAVVQIFEPASERGQRGLNELQQQTTGLLSFQKLNKEVYDEQVSFNLLSRYGEDAPVALGNIEARIERHLASLLSRFGAIPMPSLRLAQAPVFHGYTFSLWVEFEQNPGPDALAEALSSDLIEVRTGSQEPPNNVGSTNQSGLLVGSIETDRNHPQAAWFWTVADNLRLMADNAMMVAQSLLSPESAE